MPVGHLVLTSLALSTLRHTLRKAWTMGHDLLSTYGIQDPQLVVMMKVRGLQANSQHLAVGLNLAELDWEVNEPLTFLFRLFVGI